MSEENIRSFKLVLKTGFSEDLVVQIKPEQKM